MKSLLTFVFSLCLMAGMSQDCGIRFILFNDDSIVVALPFLQYAIEDVGDKAKIFVEYPPTFNFKKTKYVNWERQIRVKDSLGYILEKTGKQFVQFHITGTKYLINKEWIESVEPIDGGDHALIAGRYRGKKFTSDETYEYIIAQLFECPWPKAGGDSLEVCADNGLNVDIGTGCVEIGGVLYKNTNVSLNQKIMQFVGRRFGGGLRMNDGIDSYVLGTGTGSTTQDAYTNWFRDIDGFGRMTLAAYQILIGVPGGNGYHLPNTRPGGAPESYPPGTQWFPIWTRGGSGTGSVPGWYQLPAQRIGEFTATTDVNGDVTFTISPAMPNLTYSIIITPVSSMAYPISVHTISTSSFKVNTGKPAGETVTLRYNLEDY